LKSGFWIGNKTRNPKTDFKKNLPLDSLSFRFIGKSEKGYEKQISRTLNSGFPNKTERKKIRHALQIWIPYREEGFLEVEIRYRILCFIAKSEFQIL